MILRLAANAALHTAGGVAMGVTAALAACTVAQVAVVTARRAGIAPGGGRGHGSPTPPPPSPPPAPKVEPASQPS